MRYDQLSEWKTGFQITDHEQVTTNQSAPFTARRSKKARSAATTAIARSQRDGRSLGQKSCDETRNHKFGRGCKARNILSPAPFDEIMTAFHALCFCLVTLRALSIQALPAGKDSEDPTLAAGLFEGDIMINKDSGPTAWNSRRDQKYRWKNGIIPYHVSKDFDGLVRDLA